MTMAPAPATTGAHSCEAAAPMLNRAMSMPAWSATATSSTVTPSRTWPAERSDAKNRKRPTGSSRSLQDSAHDAADLPGRAVNPDRQRHQ